MPGIEPSADAGLVQSENLRGLSDADFAAGDPRPDRRPLVVRHLEFGSSLLACRLCGRQTFESALLNYVALELGEGTCDREEQPAIGRGGIDEFRDGVETDLFHVQALGEREQVMQGSRKAIETPDAQRIAGAKIAKRVLKPGLYHSAPADPVGEYPRASRRLEGAQLQIEVLFDGRNPCVSDLLAHHTPVA